MTKLDTDPLADSTVTSLLEGAPRGAWSSAMAFFKADWTIRVLTLTVILASWEIFGQRTSPVTFASASRSWRAFIDMWSSGTLLEAWRADLLIMFTALAVSTVTGLFLGFLFGRFRALDLFTEPIFNGIFMTPKIALLPIIALWLGFQFQAKVLVVILFSFFEIMFTVRDGVKVTNAEYIDVARAYMIPEGMLLRKIVMPASLPYVISALRLGLLHGLVGVVLAGFFLENIGIGGLISNATSNYRMDITFAAMITVMFVGVAINFGLRATELRVAPWTRVRA
jgi:ABC-type nitrate/sulfonate/bicarbonate transport system permease component